MALLVEKKSIALETARGRYLLFEIMYKKREVAMFQFNCSESCLNGRFWN